MRSVPRRRIAVGLVILAVFVAARLMVSAEPQQPVGTWEPMGIVADPRTGAAATSLSDGRTLISGGVRADGAATAGVVIYDPLANAFTAAGELIGPRQGHTATLLADGRVLIVGGVMNGVVSSDVELFDPASGTSALVALLVQPRTGHAAARLDDETVLIVGGSSGEATAVASAERFDPASGSVTQVTSQLQQPRVGASATTLIDGRVLVAGGSDGTGNLATAEIFEPVSQTF